MKNNHNKITISIFIILSIAIQASLVEAAGKTCKDLKCSQCCIENDGVGSCVTDILKCPLKPQSDFSVLVTIIVIVGAFAIGIPLMLFIIDKLFCGKFLGCKMSLCECIANFICCCFCIRRKSQGDHHELQNVKVIPV